jgi:hypothetical protein
MSASHGGLARLPIRPLPTMDTMSTDTGFPWVDGDILYAADLNAAFLPADGRLLPTSDAGLASGAYWNNGTFVCVVP